MSKEKPDYIKGVRYAPKEKRFGEQAQRITSEEYPLFAMEVEQCLVSGVDKSLPIFPLSDKPSSGDLDIIYQKEESLTEEEISHLFGDLLVGYQHLPNDHLTSILFETSTGKTIQVDLIHCHDTEAFERKRVFYAKAHLTSMVSLLAHSLGFKYGYNGFFYTAKDNKHEWQDILITGNLSEALIMLGYIPEEFERVDSLEDTIKFVSSSPYFDSTYYTLVDMLQKKHRTHSGVQAQEYLLDRLAELKISPAISDPLAIMKSIFPAKYISFRESLKQVKEAREQKKWSLGDAVLAEFNLKQGIFAGEIIKHIKKSHLDIQNLTPEIILEVRQKFNLPPFPQS